MVLDGTMTPRRRRSVVCYCRPSTLEQSPLPADVRSALSLTTFRWKLKTHIYFGNLTQTLCYNYVAIVVLKLLLLKPL